MKKQPMFLSVEEVLLVHQDQISRYGGEPGVRDRGLLESAIAVPASGIGDDYFHKDIFEMAAAYLFHIVRNHPFVDGNKRTGAVTALIFLILNGVDINADEAELESIVTGAAAGKVDKPQIAEFFRRYSQEG
jgi:death on curing protein